MTRRRQAPVINERRCAACRIVFVGRELLCAACLARRRVAVALLSNGRRAA